MGHGLWEGMERLIAALSGLLHVILHIVVPHNVLEICQACNAETAEECCRAGRVGYSFHPYSEPALLLRLAIKSYPLYNCCRGSGCEKHYASTFFTK